MRERSWALPSLALTILSFAFVLAFTPDLSGLMNALWLIPLWMLAATVAAGAYIFYRIIRMMVLGVERPTWVILDYLRSDWKRLLTAFLFVMLAGLNMIAFMRVKPLLNYLVPFWADPMLARLDNVLFFGLDPWRLLGWLNTDFMSIFYHRGWFALMILTLLLVLLQPPSREKSATMLTYFVLWSVIGPLVHILLPAAGPIFFDELGYGNRFATIPSPDSVVEASSFLWRIFEARSYGPGAGISAMPSLHIATTAWIVLVTYLFARRWLILVAPLAVLIFLLSISLGWHYALDGVVGGGLTLLVWKLAEAAYVREAAKAHAKEADRRSGAASLSVGKGS